MTTISFVDSANNTGGTITVVGSAAGSINRLWLSPFTGSNSDRSFTVEATRVGDGTIPITATKGAYLAILESVAGGVLDLSEPIAFRVTDGEDPLHQKIANAIREFVIAAALPGIPTNPALHVFAKLGAKLEEVLKKNPSCVYYVPLPESYEYLDNMTTTVKYPVAMILNIESQNSTIRNLREILAMRQLSGLGFSACPLTDVPEVHTVEIDPGSVIEPAKWALNYDVSVMTFTAISEQYEAI